MDEKESNKKEAEVVAVLRSVVQSAKGGVLISNLHSEYEFLVGQKVPYKALGYPSLEAMLRSMPDIVKISRNNFGEPVVNAVADESTAHIASLISRQRNAKPNPRRVQRRRPATMSYHSKPQASQYLPRMNAKKQCSDNFTRSSHNTQNNAPLSKSDGYPVMPRKASLGRRQQPTRYPNLPPRLQQAQNIQPPPQSFGALSGTPSNFLLKQSIKDSSPILSPPATPPPPPPLQSLSPQLLLSRTSPSPLTSIPPLLTSSHSPPPLTTSVSPLPVFCPHPVYDRSSHLYQDTGSYRDIIDAYAASKGLKVTYRSLPLNPKETPRTYVSTLMIAKQKFNSYPNDMPTIEQAEEEAARVAVEALDLLTGIGPKNLPTACMDTTEHKNIVLKRVSKIIQGFHNGLWSMKVESVYKDTYNEVLPSNWLEIVGSDITINKVGQDKCILYPMQENLVENEEDTQDKHDIGMPEPLSLPETECVDVFVSYLTSSVDVCIQLVEHSHSYQNLVEEMQSYYENSGDIVRRVEEGKLYAVNNEDYWHRVRVTNIMGDKVECYFVDHGDSVIIDKNCLYELLPRFSSLPFQALHCQLDGLAEYAENKIMLHHLTDENLLLGKTLVAKVVSREEPISLVFYDTTTDEDININEYLLRITEKDFITPKLPKVGGITKAYLSHVDRNGDVYVRVSGPALELLRTLIDEFSSQSKISLEPARSVSNHKMYCVNFKDDWYRAVVKNLPTGDEYKEVEMLFVDYGNCIMVPMIQIYELGQLTDELSGLPFQALKCHLHGITPAENEEWSKETVKQLFKLAPESQILLLKVITEATEDLPTTVELFKRIEPNDELVSINQTIAMSDSIISIKENLTTDKGLLTSNRIDERCLQPLKLRLDFLEEEIFSKGNINSPVPHNQENKIPKHYSVITPDGIGEQVDDVIDLPSLVPSTIPEIGEYFDVYIVSTANPFNFTVQPYKEGNKLDLLFKEMQTFYSSEDNTIDMDKCLLKCGQFYAGRNQRNEWLRVYVQNMFEDEEMVSAYFVDYGGYAVIGLSDLQPLWRYFRSLPFQAIRTKLYGIAPIHDDWSMTDCLTFKTLVEGKEFVSLIKAKTPDKTTSLGGQEITVVLYDTSGTEDLNINQHLKDLEIAQSVINKR